MNFDILVKQIIEANTKAKSHRKLTKRNFKIWYDRATMTVLSGNKIGDDFCKNFGIFDNFLRYQPNNARALEYIKAKYNI